jgi:hypothetical protein
MKVKGVRQHLSRPHKATIVSALLVNPYSSDPPALLQPCSHSYSTLTLSSDVEGFVSDLFNRYYSSHVEVPRKWN